MKNKILLLLILSISTLSFFYSCTTDDVVIDTSNVEANLTIDNDTIPYINGQSKIVIKLNSPALLPVKVKFKFEGTADLNKDYVLNQDELIIQSGEKEGSITLTTLESIVFHEDLNIIVKVETIENAHFDLNNSVKIIIDDGSNVSPLIINEVLYDPSNVGLEGDANNDGIYSQAEDEFIEFYNNSNISIDISGYKIFDADGLANNVPVHVFPEGTIIPAYKAIVVFGGGKPTGTFGGTIVQTSTTGNLSLNNEADYITVTKIDGSVIATFDIAPLSNNPNESYTRNPDIIGDFVRHKTINGKLFSPGTKVDGSNF